VKIEWQKLPVGKTSLREQKAQLPLLIRADTVDQIGLSVRTPASPGDYILTVHFPAFESTLASKRVSLSTDDFPTSRSSPRLLSATYSLEGIPPYIVTSTRLGISCKITNTGKATWLATSEGDRGEVRLGWRWFRKADGVPLQEEGREHLQYDVFPGQAYWFQTTVKVPPEPGHYILELGLVSELVTWFSDQGVPPLRFEVRVPDAESNASP
jgi:hypothetical protein